MTSHLSLVNINNEVKILADWEDSLAVFKPAGWLSIPGRGHKEGVPVLSHALGAQLRGGRDRGQNNDLFVVHRLDEGTSGVIVFARTSEAHRELSRLFESRSVKKTYWCIVRGVPRNETIDAPLFKLPSKKVKSVVDPKGKPSQTIIRVLAQADHYSLVEAEPLTGRSHQIRVHLAHRGFPLLGDKLYGGETEALGLKLSYPLLHARGITFSRPPGTKREAVAPAESEFLQAMTALGFAPSCTI